MKNLGSTKTTEGNAFAKMCRERLGSDAQAESRYVAEKVYEFMKQYYPVSAKALVEGV